VDIGATPQSESNHPCANRMVPRAVALYKKWSAPDSKVAAIMGWGTADTEALTGFLAQDKIPDMSGSYAAALTDPEGTSGKAKAAPYNFFYGPTYSDALRAELTWAAEDWKAKGKPGKPKFVHMGANHPYPNAPKAAGEALAAELGFEVLPPLVFALSPGDYSAQCLSLKSAGANYAYLGNTAASNISVMKACKTAGVDVQFLSNVWGMDENAAKTAGDAADGVIFPLRTAVGWGGNAPGMKTVMEISKMSDPTGKVYRPVHYIAAVCSALYMKEAQDWAAKKGSRTPRLPSKLPALRNTGSPAFAGDDGQNQLSRAETIDVFSTASSCYRRQRFWEQ
jgi:branched-chain amino acid transport system substrate-binding protein